MVLKKPNLFFVSGWVSAPSDFIIGKRKIK